MTTLPIELANAREARTEAWNAYQLVIDNPHTSAEFHQALHAAGVADKLCADLYARWQAVGGTSDIESIEAAELEQEKHKALQIVLDVTAPKDEVKFGNVIFDIPAIAENIRTRSAELKSRIDDRMIAARERMGQRH